MNYVENFAYEIIKLSKYVPKNVVRVLFPNRYKRTGFNLHLIDPVFDKNSIESIDKSMRIDGFRSKIHERIGPKINGSQ